jgi:hypothetical protein
VLTHPVRQLVPDVTNTAILEEYWELYRVNEQESPAQSNSPMDSPLSLKFMPARQRSNGESGQARTRAVSDMGALNPSEQNLSPHHPALSLMNLVDTFGPLVFPLQRAALLRKRILLVTHAPIQLACDFGNYASVSKVLQLILDLTVYNLSILSTLPLAVNDLLSSTSPASRLRPFFSIGVHDIPMLVKEAMAAETGPLSPSSTSDGYLEDVGGGWVACTTDEILAVKHDLYDVLVTLPPAHSQDAKDKIWPTIECPKGTEVKATQRDLRRYRTLRQGLSRYRDPYSDESEDNDTTSINSRAALVADQDSETSMEEGYTPVDDSRIIEAQSWASLAYSSFMWWASAGEARQDTIEEEERDASLFDHPFGPDSTPPGRPRSRSSITTFSKGSGSAKPEMALIAYFHRLTCAVLRTLGDLVDAIDGDDNPPDDETEAPVFVSSEDLTAMGLEGFCRRSSRDLFWTKGRGSRWPSGMLWSPGHGRVTFIEDAHTVVFGG